MSLPLIDFRGKITAETDAVLEAIQRSTGRDKSEIARSWLHRIALGEINGAIELQKILQREGIAGTPQAEARNSGYGGLQ
jgi:hypothetical protein